MIAHADGGTAHSFLEALGDLAHGCTFALWPALGENIEGGTQAMGRFVDDGGGALLVEQGEPRFQIFFLARQESFEQKSIGGDAG